MEISAAKPSNFSKESIENIAEVASDRSGYRASRNIKEAVSSLGGEIIITDVWSNKDSSGSLFVEGVSKFKIHIPTHTSLERDRFTIAHELGHYFIHYLFLQRSERPERLRADRYGSGRVEWEANWFAASFLMPQKEFFNSFEALNGNLNEIADMFRISVSSAKIRAKSLELI